MLVCSSVDSISSQPAPPAIELEGDELSELGRDDCHRIFLSIQAVSRGEQGLISRRASYVVSCTMGTSWSRARSADSSLSAMPSPCRRRSSAGVTSTIPIRDFARLLSISRSNGVPRATSFSLNQTRTPRDSSRSCSSLAAPGRPTHGRGRRPEGQAVAPALRRCRGRA